MILSTRTIQVLQNFQTINPSIHVKPGSEIKTVSEAGSIFAQATVQDVFDKEFAIHDLSRFLGLLSLNKQSEMEFRERDCIITQDISKIRYAYCVPALIKSAANRKINPPPAVETFELRGEVLNGVLKALNILGYNDIAFVGRDGLLTVEAINVKSLDSDTYSAQIGKTEREFMAVIEADKLKLMNSDYTVHVAEELARFSATFDDGSVDYYIALSDKHSKFK